MGRKAPALAVLFCILLSCLGSARGQGIDVSKFQGKICWSKVAKAGGIKFAYIRATEGTSIKDPFYNVNIDSARRAGILVGSYHVYSSKTSAYDQFANFKSRVSKKKQDLVPVLDIEGNHSGRLKMDRVDKLLELLEKEYGAKPMIYTSETLFKLHFSGKKYSAYPVFIARYKGTPAVRYTLWQHSSRGSVSGISSRVDLDKFHPNHSIYDIYMPRLRKKKETVADTLAKKDSVAADTVKPQK